MHPKIGIIICGFNENRQFVPNVYIQSVRLNGQPLETYHFPHSELIKGGTLEIELGSQPNKKWGVE